MRGKTPKYLKVIGIALCLTITESMSCPVSAVETEDVIQEIELKEGEQTETLSSLDQKITGEISDLDMEKEEEVTELIADLNKMRKLLLEIVWDYEDQGAAYLANDRIYINGVLRVLKLPDMNLEYRSRAWMNAENGSMVIWGVGGDTYDLYYVVDHTLLGYFLGDSGGNIIVDEHLPTWEIKALQETETEEDETSAGHNRLTQPYYEEKLEDIQERLDYTDEYLK